MRLSSVGPGAWLISDQRGVLGGLAGSLKQAVGDQGSVVDQSSALVTLHLTGAQARFVLSKLCQIDLHPRVFDQQTVVRSIVAQVSTVVYQGEDGTGFDILVPATLARSVTESLLEAAAEFGCVYG